MNVINHPPSSCQLSAMSGTIERRMLVNFRCEPNTLAKLLPPPFRPKLIHGWGMAGICLIRLGGMRPTFLPALDCLTSENAAHRIAVEWDENRVVREGVFVPRRDTDAWLNRLVGGKLFPGNQHAAKFEVTEKGDHIQLKMHSDDGVASVEVQAQVTNVLPSGSVFKSLTEASEFFAMAHSVGRRVQKLMALMAWNWSVMSGEWNRWRSNVSIRAFLATRIYFRRTPLNSTALFLCAISHMNGAHAVN